MKLMNSRLRILTTNVIFAVIATYLACLIAQIIYSGWPSVDWLMSEDACFLLGFAAMYGSFGGLCFGVLAFRVKETERFGFVLLGTLATAVLLAIFLFQWIEGMASV